MTKNIFKIFQILQFSEVKAKSGLFLVFENEKSKKEEKTFLSQILDIIVLLASPSVVWYIVLISKKMVTN
jgi:hypothetical protein